jgi:hypothetical protein
VPTPLGLDNTAGGFLVIDETNGDKDTAARGTLTGLTLDPGVRIASTPEPGSLALFAAGLTGLACAASRSRRCRTPRHGAPFLPRATGPAGC